MIPFDPAGYPPAIADLCSPDRLPELGPGEPDQAFRPALASLRVEELFPKLRDGDAATACLSGLWLHHDFLDDSHRISQDLETPEGSYWHAIMHRREPDASNSKYWFRRVGAHPVVSQLAEQAPGLGYDYTDPFAFVDFCERVRGTNSADTELAKRVQLLEWRLLFDWCFRKAVG